MIDTGRHRGNSQISVAGGIRDALQERSFALVDAAGFQLSDDLAVARRHLFGEWDHLEPDDYLRDGAGYRRRRFGLFYFTPPSDELLAMPPEVYHQRLGLNTYAGGINRRFAPLSQSALGNEFLHELIRLLFRQLPIESDRLSHPWLVDVHQIRITATVEEQGEATPEGPHHDGEEFVIAQLVQRRNVRGGINTVYSNAEEPMSSSTLREPLDTLLLWDPHVMHGVSPIHPVDPDEPGIRDTLLIGYDPRPRLKRPAIMPA